MVVTNGTVAAAPQPGDVVSIGRTQYDEFGHTAVVTATTVDAQGNGTITLIQQNGGAGNDGWTTYAVNNWVVGDGVTGWLHNPLWTYQWPLVGFASKNVFQAGVVAPGNGYAQVTTNASSIAVSGYAGTTGTNGNAIYGYIDQDRQLLRATGIVIHLVPRGTGQRDRSPWQRPRLESRSWPS